VLEYALAIVSKVLVKTQPKKAPTQQARERRLARLQRLASQVLVIQLKEVEGVKKNMLARRLAPQLLASPFLSQATASLAVRIGIATGLVVVGDLSREAALWEHALVGDTSNPAVDHIHFRAYAKRQSAAASGRLTLSSGLRSAATP